jgi:DNA polymerase
VEEPVGGSEDLSQPGPQPTPAPTIPAPAEIARSKKTPSPSSRPRGAAASASPTSLFATSEFDQPIVPPCERQDLLAAEAVVVAACHKCPHLAEIRTQTVYGTGSPTARLLFVGEAPGADEDRAGVPFVGRAGQLLTDMITKGMGLSRDEVYIANVIKCRPPENRTPTSEEAANCFAYLERQIAIVRPEFLCLLGKTAAQALLDITPSTTMGQLRGRWHRYRGIKTLVTYHPSYLLRVPSAKKDAWEDLQLLMKEMDLPLPKRK